MTRDFVIAAETILGFWPSANAKALQHGSCNVFSGLALGHEAGGRGGRPSRAAATWIATAFGLAMTRERRHGLSTVLAGHAPGVLARALGGVHGLIGGMQQAFGGIAVARVAAQAEAGAQRGLIVEHQIHRGGQAAENTLGDGVQGLLIGQVGDDGHEFVAAQPGDQVAGFERVVQAVGDGALAFVAGGVT